VVYILPTFWMGVGVPYPHFFDGGMFLAPHFQEAIFALATDNNNNKPNLLLKYQHLYYIYLELNVFKM